MRSPKGGNTLPRPNGLRFLDEEKLQVRHQSGTPDIKDASSTERSQHWIPIIGLKLVIVLSDVFLQCCENNSSIYLNRCPVHNLLLMRPHGGSKLPDVLDKNRY